MEERRRGDARQVVRWPARLWLTDTCFLGGHAVNAGVHGTWVYLNWLQSRLLMVGETYRLEVWPGGDEGLTCLAVVRHVNRYGAGLEIREELPVAQPAPLQEALSPNWECGPLGGRGRAEALATLSKSRAGTITPCRG